MKNPDMTREFNHIIPNEISSEVKLVRGLTFRRLVIVMALWLVLNSFSNAIHPSLQLAYTLFTLLFAVAMVLPSAKSPGKMFYETILLTFTKDTTVYHPIEEQEITDDEEAT